MPREIELRGARVPSLVLCLFAAIPLFLVIHRLALPLGAIALCGMR